MAKEFKNKSIERVIIPDPGKVQPQSLELERAVLGALMLEKEAFSTVSSDLRQDFFYDKKHGLIYKAIVNLSSENRPIDLLTVGEQLKKNGDLAAAGGLTYLAGLTDNVVSSAHLEFHSKIIAQKYIARELIMFTGAIQEKAFDDTKDVEELMQEAEGKLFDISQKNIKKDAIQIDPIINEAIAAINNAAARKDGLSGVSSGFTLLDRITSGWQNSDLIIIAARPSMGKTAFVLSMAKNMAINHKTPVAIFSLEMSNVQLVNRLISNVCELEGEKLKSGKLAQHEWEQLDIKVKDLFYAPIYVDDTPSLSIFELRTKARRLVREHGVKCIIIDYLQLMNASGMQYGSREQEVSIISRSLKGLAKELNLPIIALSQLNRLVETRTGEGKRPQLSDLRESGAIEQDADMVCFIHRPERYGVTHDSEGKDLTGLAEIIVAKHRNGAIGDLWLSFRKEFVRFENINDYVGDHEYTSKEIRTDGGRDFSSQAVGNNDDFANRRQNDPFGGSNDGMPF